MKRVYICGLAALGIAVGVFAGGSNTPVVGTVIPLLFGLIATGSVFFATKREKGGVGETVDLALLGGSLVGFCLPAVVAALYMSLVRTGEPISSLFPAISKQAPYKAPVGVDIGSYGSVKVLHLLSLLKAPTAVSQRVLANLSERAASQRTIRIGLLAQINALEGACEQDVKALTDAAASLNNEESVGEVLAARSELRAYCNNASSISLLSGSLPTEAKTADGHLWRISIGFLTAQSKAILSTAEDWVPSQPTIIFDAELQSLHHANNIRLLCATWNDLDSSTVSDELREYLTRLGSSAAIAKWLEESGPPRGGFAQMQMPTGWVPEELLM